MKFLIRPTEKSGKMEGEKQKQHGQDELEDLMFTCDLFIPITLFDFYHQVFGFG